MSKFYLIVGLLVFVAVLNICHIYYMKKILSKDK